MINFESLIVEVFMKNYPHRQFIRMIGVLPQQVLCTHGSGQNLMFAILGVKRFNLIDESTGQKTELCLRFCPHCNKAYYWVG